MKQRKCLIIAGGELKEPARYQELAQNVQYIIAADGGARHANELGLLPNLVVGDFDTLSADEVRSLAKQGIELAQYPVDKDYSDTHLALLKALELGYTEITIIAALGGRIDHTLANIMLLALPEARDIKLNILADQQELILIRKEALLTGEPGTIVSLLPLSEQVTGITTDGLAYQVPQHTFIMGHPNGISNVMTGKEARIKVAEGLLLAVITRYEGESRIEG